LNERKTWTTIWHFAVANGRVFIDGEDAGPAPTPEELRPWVEFMDICRDVIDQDLQKPKSK
jgi:hypothetical protein